MLALGTRFSERATRSSDKKAALDVTGRSAKGWTLKIPQKMAHVDIDAAEFNHNYPTQIGVHADARDFLQKLLAELGRENSNPPSAAKSKLRSSRIARAWRSERGFR